MATSDDALETYNHLPVHIDPASKQISITSSDKSLQEAIATINNLHQSFKSLDTPNHAPPPPIPVKPQRSAQIQKLRDSAAISARKGQLDDAIRMLSLAIDMASSRPAWEPVGLVREELAICYMARANVHVLGQNWVSGWKDAECSTECKRGPQTGPNGEKAPGNSRAFVLGGTCLVEMCRWADAVKWLERAIEIEGADGDDGREMQRLLAQAKARAEKTEN